MEDFDALLDQLPDSVRDVMDEIMDGGGDTPRAARLFARLHKAPEHVVLAICGFLPNANGDYVHAHLTKEKLRIRDAAHWAAWKIHLLAIQPSAKVEVDPNVA